MQLPRIDAKLARFRYDWGHLYADPSRRYCSEAHLARVEDGTILDADYAFDRDEPSWPKLAPSDQKRVSRGYNMTGGGRGSKWRPHTTYHATEPEGPGWIAELEAILECEPETEAVTDREDRCRIVGAADPERGGNGPP